MHFCYSAYTYFISFLEELTKHTGGQLKKITLKIYFCLPYSRKQFSSALHDLSSTEQIHVI